MLAFMELTWSQVSRLKNMPSFSECELMSHLSTDVSLTHLGKFCSCPSACDCQREETSKFCGSSVPATARIVQPVSFYLVIMPI